MRSPKKTTARCRCRSSNSWGCSRRKSPLSWGGLRELRRLATVDVSPLRHRDFRLLFWGQLISMLGSQITYVAIPFQVSMFGGLIADHGDRGRVVLVTEFVFALLSTLLLLNALLPEPRLDAIYVLAGLQAGLFALQRPSLEALTPRLVERSELTAAGALTALRGTLGMLAGPAVGGTLIVVGLPATFGADVATFVFSLVALFPAIAEGLGGPTVLGLLYSAPAAGALLAGATSGWTNHVRRHGMAVIVAASVCGLAIVGFGVSPTPALALLMLAVAGAADAVSGIFRQSIWNHAVPDALRGRMASIEMVS